MKEKSSWDLLSFTSRRREAPARGDGEAEESFGDVLRHSRRETGRSLEELSRSVRVPLRHLEDLENEEFDSLPPEPYVRGYLDACACELHLDGKELFTLYERALLGYAHRGSDVGKGAVFALFRTRGEKVHLRDWSIPLAVAIVACMVVIGQWLMDFRGDGTAALPPAGSDVATVLEEAAPLFVNVPAVLLPVASEGDSGVSLVVRAEGSTWISAKSDGFLTKEWTLRGGETKVITADERLVVSLGNAGVVKLTYNGMELGFIGQKGEVKKSIVFTSPEETIP